MTEYKCGSAESCKYGDMCKPNYNIGACSHYKAEEPMTNEKWFRSCNTEQLAEFLDRISDFCEMCENHCDNDTGMQCNGDFKGHWVEWLKQPHKPIS